MLGREKDAAWHALELTTGSSALALDSVPRKWRARHKGWGPGNLSSLSHTYFFRLSKRKPAGGNANPIFCTLLYTRVSHSSQGHPA
jgi:hypothetical protein